MGNQEMKNNIFLGIDGKKTARKKDNLAQKAVRKNCSQIVK
jgi:hypothetical protein